MSKHSVNEGSPSWFWALAKMGFMCSLSQITVTRTCKLLVSVATATKLGDQLASEVEDEDGAGLVVHHDEVTVLIH